jgi:hypothetical protein
MGRGKRAEWGMGTGRTRSSNGARNGALARNLPPKSPLNILGTIGLFWPAPCYKYLPELQRLGMLIECGPR